MEYSELTGLKGPFRVVSDMDGGADCHVVDSQDKIFATVEHASHGDKTKVIAESIRNGLCLVEFRHNACEQIDISTGGFKFMVRSFEQQVGRALTEEEINRLYSIQIELSETLAEFADNPPEIPEPSRVLKLVK